VALLQQMNLSKVLTRIDRMRVGRTYKAKGNEHPRRLVFGTCDWSPIKVSLELCLQR